MWCNAGTDGAVFCLELVSQQDTDLNVLHREVGAIGRDLFGAVVIRPEYLFNSR